MSAELRLVRKGRVVLDQARRFLDHQTVEGIGGNPYKTLQGTICNSPTYNHAYVATSYVGPIFYSPVGVSFFLFRPLSIRKIQRKNFLQDSS